ncbi:MAG: LacI family DNA-binding transcriptional regulator [Candidatus Kappaea frigidicola]|nr:LacI family DNA-binding transcriptional regulator [Candidatus Kappaea frigidicola]
MSITYKDIARKAGVSISTVSRVINQTDLHKVGKTTQKKVEKIVEKLDFTPNVIARSLVSRKTYNVAVAIKDLEDIINPYFNQVISGIAGVLERRGYFLQLVRTVSAKEKALSPYYLKAIQEKRVDGLILLSEEAKNKDVIELFAKKVPVILVNRTIPNITAPSVLIDNEGGLYDATKELIELKHKRIVFLAGSFDFQLDKQRLKGYKKALKEANISYDKSLIIEGAFNFNQSATALGGLLKKKVKFSAIVASDDVMALACINLLNERGYKVPEDISVIGFNDMLLLPLASSLSSMKLPLVELGRKAATMLLSIINNDPIKEMEVIFKPELIKRNSIGINKKK